MSDYFYAQIDSNNVVIAISQLAGVVIADHMIRINSFDESLHGQVYNPSDGTFKQPPTPVPTLSDAKATKLSELEQSFNNSLLNGFTSMADGTSRLYPIDPESMAKLTSASTVINGGKVASIVIKDFNGNRVTLTTAQYQQMAADGFTFYNMQEQHLWNLQDNVKAATDIPTVNAITW